MVNSSDSGRHKGSAEWWYGVLRIDECTRIDDGKKINTPIVVVYDIETGKKPSAALSVLGLEPRLMKPRIIWPGRGMSFSESSLEARIDQDAERNSRIEHNGKYVVDIAHPDVTLYLEAKRALNVPNEAYKLDLGGVNVYWQIELLNAPAEGLLQVGKDVYKFKGGVFADHNWSFDFTSMRAASVGFRWTHWGLLQGEQTASVYFTIATGRPFNERHTTFVLHDGEFYDHQVEVSRRSRGYDINGNGNGFKARVRYGDPIPVPDHRRLDPLYAAGRRILESLGLAGKSRYIGEAIVNGEKRWAFGETHKIFRLGRG